jgi:hypothetical protein
MTFINDDRTTITLRREELLRAIILSVARGLRRQRAGVQPELPAACPMCLGPITAELHRSLVDKTGDWYEAYVFECERCGFGDGGPVKWPEHDGLSLRQYLWGPLVDVIGTEAGSWDAQRLARQLEERPRFDPLNVIYELAREARIDVGVVITEARMAGLIEDIEDMTEPELEGIKTAFAILDGGSGSDEEGDS